RGTAVPEPLNYTRPESGQRTKETPVTATEFLRQRRNRVGYFSRDHRDYEKKGKTAPIIRTDSGRPVAVKMACDALDDAARLDQIRGLPQRRLDVEAALGDACRGDAGVVLAGLLDALDALEVDQVKHPDVAAEPRLVGQLRGAGAKETADWLLTLCRRITDHV